MQTKILSARNDRESLNKLVDAANIIKQGGLVVFPTETVYGLGADATNAYAAKKIYEAKGRPSDNPLIIHIAFPKDAEEYAFTNSVYYLLAEKFMPGPITVVMPAKSSVPYTVRGGLDTVAVRCPSNSIAHELIKLSGVPIAAPSANLSGSPSPTNIAHVKEDMDGRVDMIIDGGDCDFGLESTIVKVDDDSSVTLLRPGKITIEEIEALGLNVTLAKSVVEQMSDNEKVLSPGMKYKHYAPKAPLILIEGDASRIADYILDKNEKCAVIAYTEDIEFLSSKLKNVDFYDFGSVFCEEEQAHLLFKILRDTDHFEYSVIYAPIPKEKGIGLALYNRMIRAAAHKIIRL